MHVRWTPRRHETLVAVLAVAVMVSCGGDDRAADDVAMATTTAPTSTTLPPTTLLPTTLLPTTSPPTTTVPTTTLSNEQYVDALIGAEAVCHGAGMADAAAYDPEDPGPHPVLVFAGNHPDYSLYELLPDPSLPDGWVADLNQYAEAELVACVDGRDGLELARVCEVSGEPDRSVEIYSAAGYEVTLRVAATGEVIASDVVSGTEPMDCPLGVIFSGHQTLVRLYTVPSGESLGQFLAPHVAP